jgi:Protein of unknown function (DUF3365)
MFHATMPSMKRSFRSLLLVIATAGCGQAAEAPAPPEPSRESASAPSASASPDHSAAEREALAAANAAADELGRTLRARLLEAMADGAPAAAEVCANEAATRTAEVGARNHASVGRGSTRMRGATPPPPWVQAWLVAQREGSAEGVTGWQRVEEGHARVLRPIVIEAPCLTCHGETVSPEVQALLATRYPDDRATGYRLGDLRGALWAEVALP